MTDPDDVSERPATETSSPRRTSVAAEALTSDPRAAELVDALDALRARLAALRLPLETPGAPAARADLARAVDQLDDYLLPRLRAERAPLLVVVGGSTGAGKSTLVNSVLGEHVTAPGVLRPTTRSPVLVHHPLDARWFTTERVLPGLARVTTAVPEPAVPGPAVPEPAHGAAGARSGAGAGRTLRLVASEALPQGLALLDAPDIDSVETANRELAAQLLGAADLWLFVTTAARYADAVPWDLLRTAAERHAQVALVLDRVDPGAEAVVEDLRRMTGEHGLGEAPVFVVPEAGREGPESLDGGLLPERAVAEVSTWLSGLGGDPEARRRVITATRDGVVDDLVRRAVHLADAADAQEAADARLREAAERHHDDAVRQVEQATSDGAIMRGEVLARWQDFVGTGEFFRSVEKGVGRVRDAVGAFFRGRPTQAPQVEQAIAHGLESVVLDAAEQAAERTYDAWRGDPAGAPLLDGLELSRTSANLRTEIGEQVRGWQGDVLALVREQGAARRGTARALSLGVNALGVSLMVVVFAASAGLTGAEIGIAGGTAIVAQKLLEAVFGDDAVRRLAAQAKQRLSARVAAVMTGQAARYVAQLDALGTAEAGGPGLREVARRVEDAAAHERAGRPERPAGTTRPWTGRLLRGAGTVRPPERPESHPVPAASPGRGDVTTETEGRDDPGFWGRLFGRRGRA
ncbi:ABC transporter [Xylanimonas oleitrophica]|uniref:ABC transporter n=1 Tax=Xylanimonas oleitrophica TaxID=2607479 RepID=A0A2W5X421_9MICO|nr:dynamin family protein [Xylanimonas oleitrophica]PZR55185.1 ABC transporter [Xylanimonas oleitrophica]